MPDPLFLPARVTALAKVKRGNTLHTPTWRLDYPVGVGPALHGRHQRLPLLGDREGVGQEVKMVTAVFLLHFLARNCERINILIHLQNLL